MSRDADTVDAMARLLRCKAIDLNDERAVMRALLAARFSSGEVVMLCDLAIAAARNQTAEHGALK
jgi:hypothetical protein